MLEYVHRCFVLEHLEHQIVEAEWDTRGDAFEYCGVHTVDAHAHEMRECRLLAKARYKPVRLVDHAEIHFRRAVGGGDRKSRVISAMTADELIEVEIG